jgi:hypothetical protein
MNEQVKSKICFRNDDVNILSPELIDLTSLFIEKRIPITHAIEPANVTMETASWLKALKRKNPDLIEIVQHGWKHKKYGAGEFGKSRTYYEQLEDLQRGKDKMEKIFGEYFFPLLTFPFGVYDKNTIKAANNLKFAAICTYYNDRIANRLFYFIGRHLKKGQIFNKNISYHLNYHPYTNLFQIDTTISFIKNYHDDYGKDCDFFSYNEIINGYEKAKKRISVIVFLLHHRFHHKKEHIHLVELVLNRLISDKTIEFHSARNIYRHYGNLKSNNGL